MLKRTMKCGEARPTHAGRDITLNGWVNSTRNHGGILFIDIRDHTGVTQLVFDPETDKTQHETASSLRREDVIAARGKVAKRQSVNPHIPTGEVELIVTQLEVLNRAERMPILPDDNIGDVSEEQRLRYRYVDLRRPRMQEILRTRHKVMQIVRQHMSSEGFIEIETPILCKSTPEGARDFLVPSRLMAGNFYALPQSPQILKQILMMSGCDRYFQIVRCFRDENLRADRQPEFTQLDVEMAFVEQEDVFAAFEGVVRAIWKGVLNHEVGDLPRLTYTDAMNRFGSDKPDLRFGMELIDLTDLAGKSEFKVFSAAVANGGVVKAIRVPGGAAKLTRKQTDELQEWVKTFGAGGLPLVKITANGYETGIAKFITGALADQLRQRMQAEEGDLLLFAADKAKIANRVLGQLRIRLGKDLKLIDESQWSMFWVVDFPLMEFNDEEHRWEPAHHPFCSPRLDQVDLMETDPGAVIAQTYDFVINGNEVLSGSIRIHRTDMQAKIFKMLRISDEDAKSKFGFLLDALKYGCPPHGGFAMGFDRIIMLLCNTDNIRDVIAFPKTQTGADLMMNCPSEVTQEQLDELSLRLSPGNRK